MNSRLEEAMRPSRYNEDLTQVASNATGKADEKPIEPLPTEPPRIPIDPNAVPSHQGWDAPTGPVEFNLTPASASAMRALSEKATRAEIMEGELKASPRLFGRPPGPSSSGPNGITDLRPMQPAANSEKRAWRMGHNPIDGLRDPETRASLDDITERIARQAEQGGGGPVRRAQRSGKAIRETTAEDFGDLMDPSETGPNPERGITDTPDPFPLAYRDGNADSEFGDDVTDDRPE